MVDLGGGSIGGGAEGGRGGEGGGGVVTLVDNELIHEYVSCGLSYAGRRPERVEGRVTDQKMAEGDDDDERREVAPFLHVSGLASHEGLLAMTLFNDDDERSSPSS